MNQESPWKTGDTIRVVLVDDHDITRRGVAEVLRHSGIEVAAEAETASAAMGQIRLVRPDIVVTAGILPDADAAQLIRDIGSDYPDIRCLVLTGEVNDVLAYECMLAGASGFLLHTVPGASLGHSIRAIQSGIGVWGIGVADGLRNLMRRERTLDQLTPQERKILGLIGEGLTNRQIGSELRLSERTVKNYASAVIRKLGVSSRAAAASYATRMTLMRTAI
ncbi:response regulator transcription factor [Yinghuangia sp. YIM S09857]|uniref:response regulator transcription factor n=1 Tax=Yinghuangia sp. YIM S09857 TaxID=3436929 RepID=UPI003F531A86